MSKEKGLTKEEKEDRIKDLSDKYKERLHKKEPFVSSKLVVHSVKDARFILKFANYELNEDERDRTLHFKAGKKVLVDYVPEEVKRTFALDAHGKLVDRTGRLRVHEATEGETMTLPLQELPARKERVKEEE